MSAHDEPRPGPLTGYRVLDLTRFIAGPVCCQVLGDMGAEVVKIERPGGEDSRRHAPLHRGNSVYSMIHNRNKYGATLDTRHPRALPLLERLVEQSDVVVENYRPGTMAAMGLDYERLTRIRSDAILVSISGFGQTGPLAERALFDAIAQAESGLMSLTGDADGDPALAGTFIADYLAGQQGAMGAAFALLHRERTGEGQHVDIASLDALFAAMGPPPSVYAMLGTEPERGGTRDQLSGPANLFRAKDGHVYIHAGTDSLFARMCAAIGRPDLAADERYRRVEGRMADIEVLEDAVAAWVGPRTRDEVAAALTEAGVPFGRVADVADVVDSAQIAARDMVVDVEHPAVGPLRLPGIPVKLGASPGTVRKAPPLVGEDNDYVYGRLLGLSAAEIDELRAEGAV